MAIGNQPSALLLIAASLIYFLCMMVRLWNVLEAWSPETLRSLVGGECDHTPLS
ncbi:MAG TPA: hypothetical protein VJQ51_14425 [Burkholderiales bacterium]|nr:hypothetical protein [Burkholderiales bacterium]